jgi:HEAT repeat protein
MCARMIDRMRRLLLLGLALLPLACASETDMLMAGATPEEWEEYERAEEAGERMEEVMEGSLSDDPLPALLEGMRDDYPEVRIFALTDLPRLGHRATPAIPRLLELLASDPDLGVREFAASALGQLGPLTPEVVPALVAALEPDSGAVLGANEALQAIGPPPDAAEPLQQLLEHERQDYRAAAAKTLAKLEAPPADALDVLVATLRRADRWSRDDEEAVVALAALGEPAIAPLLEVLETGEHEARLNASNALALIGPPAVPALVDALGHRNKRVRGLAARALAAMPDSGAQAAAPALLDAVGSARDGASKALLALEPRLLLKLQPEVLARIADGRLRRLAGAYLLAGMGKESLPALLTAIRQPNDDLRGAAAWAIGELDLEEAAVTHLLPDLKDPSAETRELGALALRDMKWRAASAVHGLAEALGDREVRVRTAAANALGEIGETASPAGGALAESLQDPSRRVVDAARRALTLIGTDAHDAALVEAHVHALQRSLGKDPDAATDTIRLLRKLGPRGSAAVATLLEAVDRSEDRTVRWEAVCALGDIGPAAAAAEPTLRALLDRRVRGRDDVNVNVVILSLYRILPAEAIRPLLEELSQSEHALKRQTALGLLKKLDRPR